MIFLLVYTLQAVFQFLQRRLQAAREKVPGVLVIRGTGEVNMRGRRRHKARSTGERLKYVRDTRLWYLIAKWKTFPWLFAPRGKPRLLENSASDG